MKHAAILLAAGFSRRFGSDKRLACIDGEPMLLASLRRLQSALEGISRVELQIVVRAWDPLVAPMLAGIVRDEPECLLQAPAWPVGMGVSIAAGVDALLRRGCRPDSVAICLADMPFIEPETLQRLMFASRPKNICVPLFEGRRGHPVVFGNHFFPQLLKLRGSRGAEKILRAHPDAIREYPVEDAGVILDIDRPGDFHSAVQPDPAGRSGTARGTAAGALLASRRG